MASLSLMDFDNDIFYDLSQWSLESFLLTSLVWTGTGEMFPTWSSFSSL